MRITPTTRKYLDLLRGVPDDIILSVASRELQLNNPNACVCGWIVRESLARELDRDATEIDAYQPSTVDDFSDCSWVSVPERCARRFGGDVEDWCEYFGKVVESEGAQSEDPSEPVTADGKATELSFLIRLDEAVVNSCGRSHA